MEQQVIKVVDTPEDNWGWYGRSAGGDIANKKRSIAGQPERSKRSACPTVANGLRG